MKRNLSLGATDPESVARRLIDLARTIVNVHAQIVMDTEADRALHDKAVSTFIRAINVEETLLNREATR